MQAYWFTVQMPGSRDVGCELADLQWAIAEFRLRINNPLLMGGVPSDSDEPACRAYDRISTAWSATRASIGAW